MPTLGIALVTYSRLKVLRRTLRALARRTKRPFVLVIAEDGGEDGTREWCIEKGYRVISGQNRGVSWNKNRGLFALAALGCDPILLLEDDCYPVENHWEDEWARATELWQHVGYAHKRVTKGSIAGAGTPEDPFVSLSSSAQCASISAAALDKVGFFDTRFTGCGIEHKEWTNRLMKAGYGVRRIQAPSGTKHKGQVIAGREILGKLHIIGGLRAGQPPSHRSEEAVLRNRRVAREIKNEPVFRLPWRSSSEKKAFLLEQEHAGVPDLGKTVALLEAVFAPADGNGYRDSVAALVDQSE